MIYLRKQLEDIEDKILAPYAMKANNSKWRLYKEQSDNYRTCFQIDRDRILHSKSFRRLSWKTQVFPCTNSWDHVRNRLVHTIEVEQIWRVISRNLWLNEDLTEVIAKAHDIGHTPYWHAGQDTLNELLKEKWLYFEHNLQSKRVLEILEYHSKNYEWLNLSYEVLEWLWKHKIKPWYEQWALPFLEAQVVNIADQIAYLAWDVDDWIWAWIIQLKDLAKLQIFTDISDNLAIDILDKDSFWRLIWNIIWYMAKDLITNTNKTIEKFNIKSQKDVENSKIVLVWFSDTFFTKVKQLREYLFNYYYMDKDIIWKMKKGKNEIRLLFKYFSENISVLPNKYKKRIDRDWSDRCIWDYISWMTDKFTSSSYNKYIK